MTIVIICLALFIASLSVGMVKGRLIRIRKSVLNEIAKLDGIFINNDIKNGEVDNNKHAILFRSMNGEWTINEEENTDRKYVGEIKNGRPNGQGTVTRNDGKTYAGEFRTGRLNGH